VPEIFNRIGTSRRPSSISITRSSFRYASPRSSISPVRFGSPLPLFQMSLERAAACVVLIDTAVHPLRSPRWLTYEGKASQANGQGAVGAQNDRRYAVFPETRRLVDGAPSRSKTPGITGFSASLRPGAPTGLSQSGARMLIGLGFCRRSAC
jgi:hypothetical protein